MKILVIDDSQVHIDAAIRDFPNDELTTTGTYKEGIKLIKEGNWDAVLCDLNMPCRSHGETAVGWSLALLAAKHGAEYVIMLTDANHHQDGDSASVDCLLDHTFSIEGAKVMFDNNTLSSGKNWAKKLERLKYGPRWGPRRRAR